MIKPQKPLNEQERLEALHTLKVLDTPPEESYDRHVRKLAQILDVPIACIALIDANRQWLKSVVGPMECEMDRDQSFCGHTILENQPLIISDTREDPRFAGNPMVTGEPHLRFYAGVPLSSADGFNVGTLCIADQKPRHLSAGDLEVLKAFAAVIEEKINRTPKIFISYSHKDEVWKDRLVSHLAVLKNQDLLDFWDDRKIDTGGVWRDEIQEAIESANVAILLISADFLTSNFILGEEMPRLLERRDKEGLHIMPVVIKSCPWQQVSWLEQMNMYPKDANPLACVEDHEIDLCLAEFASKVLEKSRGTHQRFEPVSWPVAVATEADAAPHEAPRPVPPAEQPVAVAARTDAAPIVPAATRPRSNKLLFAGLVVFMILFMITVGILSGVIEMQGKANANGATVERNTASAPAEERPVAQEVASETPAETKADEGAPRDEPAAQAVTPPPVAKDRTRPAPAAATEDTTAEAEADSIEAVEQPVPEEPDRAEETPETPETPPSAPEWEQQATREIAALVERFRAAFEAEDAEELKPLGIDIEGWVIFFKDAKDIKVTASQTLPDFENEEAAQVTVTYKLTYKLQGDRGSPFAQTFLWDVAYRNGRWEIIRGEAKVN